LNDNIMNLSLKILEKYPLCNNCLGRQFALLAKGVSNYDRGFSLKLSLTMEAHKLIKKGYLELGVKILRILAENGNFNYALTILNELGYGAKLNIKSCYLCNNIFSKLDLLADRIIQKLSEYEFSSFLVGSRIPGEIAEKEDALKSEFNIDFGESFKSEFNRELGKKIQLLTGKEVDFSTPDIVIIVDLVNNKIEINPSPLFIYGRYRKLVRGIPQCTWICSNCRGVGCEKCNFTGKKYPTSIQELIASPILEFTQGKCIVFHGAGREDVDARMLGNGRPFIVEVKEPKKRFIDLKKLEERINENAKGMVEVLNLRFSNRQEIKKLKALAQITEKTYRALVKLSRSISEDKLRELEEFFTNREIKQRTPKRVLYRRTDKVRIKRVYEIKAKIINPNLIELIIKCQGGLYVKELINGDDGRTKPSIAEFLGMDAECVELDVIDVAS